MKKPACIRTLLLAITLSCGASVDAHVKLAPVFSDNAVLQRSVDVPIWGTADKGEKVSVTFAGQTKTITANEDGKWMIKLTPLTASKEGRILQAVGADNTASAKNIVVGEVWIASGQSNMEQSLWGGGLRHRNANGTGKQVADKTNLPLLRFVKMPRKWASKPSENDPVVWHEAVSGKHLESASAASFFFGRELLTALDVPIGIMGAYWGGTRIEPWTTPEGFNAVPELANIAKEVNAKLASGQAYKNHQQPTVLYNKMLYPFVPYAIKGAIWYQGESNLTDGALYQYKLQALLAGWKKVFNNPDLKFYFAQLAPFNYRHQPTQLPLFWEAQQQFADTEADAGMVVLTDAVHNINDIHPADKEVVGKRLALLALNRDYGMKTLKADSPQLKGHAIKGDSFILDFNHLESWKTDGKAIPYFAVAAADKTYHPAQVEVKGKQLIVRSDKVTAPKTLRYMWHQSNQGKLANEAGLVLGAFRIE